MPVIFFMVIVLFVSSFMFELTLAVVGDKYDEITEEKTNALKKARKTILRALRISDGM